MKRSVKWLRPTALAACSLLAAATAMGGIAALPFHASAESAYTVDLSKPYQTFDGWGLSLSWWATEIGNWTRIGSSGKQKREEIAEALYGKTGLDLNIARYNIGGGDDPAHVHMSDDRNTPGWRLAHSETFQDGEGNDYSATVVDEDYVFGSMDDPENWADWQDTPDYRQLWVLDWIQNNPARAEDYISEFYSNSPPYWMTITGCSSGGEGAGQNLVNDEEHNQAFVEYFLDVYEYLTSQGFRLDNLQPFNESGSDFWGENGDQEGCYFSPEQKVQILCLLRDEMERRGLDVPYNWGDETNTDVAYNQYSLATAYAATDSEGNRVPGDEIVKGASRYTYHIYSYNVSGTQRMYRTAQQDGKEIYMSEICWSESDDDGEANYDPDSLATGFKYTQSIMDTVKHGGVDGYVFWQGMEDMLGQMKGNTNYGLIQGVYYTQEEGEAQGYDLASMGLTYQDYVLAKTYYMSGQFTKYIRPGYRIIDVTDNNSLAAVSPDGETLVIVKNNNSGADAMNYELKGFKASSVERIITDKTNSWAHSYLATDGKHIVDTAPAHSVVTYVIKGERTSGDGYFLDDSAFRKVADVAAAEDALLDNGDTAQCYTNLYTGGGNSAHYGDTLSNWKENADNGDGLFAAFRFYGTGFGITAPQKKDAGHYDIYIDAFPDTADPTATVELYRASQLDGDIVYRNNSLEEGWHTVWLITQQTDKDHKWVNLDGVHIYTSVDKTEKAAPVITSANGINGRVSLLYTAEGFDEYDLYLEVFEQGASDWRRLPEKLSGGEAEFETSSKSVRFRIAAEKDGETVYSPVYANTVLNIVPQEGVLYYVDCGTQDPTVLAKGAVFGELQSVLDRAYGKDPMSGAEWGYKGTLQGEGYFADYDAMTSVAAGEKFKEGYIEYEFEIPEAGAYRVTLGFFGGDDGWGQRTVAVTVGSKKQDVTLNESTYTHLTLELNTTEASQKITVKVEKSAGDSPLLSNIIIAEQTAEAFPLYTTLASELSSEASPAIETLNVGSTALEKAEAVSFSLVFSDGTKKDYTGKSEGVDMLFTAGSMSMGGAATAQYTIEEYGLALTKTYMWAQAGAEVLYYNIDCGYIKDGGTPPDDAKELGIYQSTTHDRQYGSDTKGHDWGYVGSHYDDGVNWANNDHNEWSIREGKDADQSVAYKMTGFRPDEPLHIDIAAHCHEWGDRTANVICNDVTVGDFLIKSASGGTITRKSFEGEGVKADSKGELVFKLSKKSGDGPQIGYIKVRSVGALDQESAIGVDKTSVEPDGTVTLSGLTTGATVYILDQANHLLGNFAAPAEGTKEIEVSAYALESTATLRFIQATDKTALSAAAVVSIIGREVAEDPLDIDITVSEEIVKNGDYAVAIIKPVTTRGVTSLTIIAADGAVIDLTDSFFFRTRQNGTYTVELVSGGESFRKDFTIDTIDAVDFGTSYNSAWTKGSVTVTFAPKADEKGTGSIVGFAVDGQEKELTDGKFTLEVTENRTVKAEIRTSAGFTYEESIEISNIDKETPELELDLGFSLGEGLTLDFAAAARSGGTLRVTLGGQEIDSNGLASGVISLEEEGKYEIVFVSGAGNESAKAVYYVSHGAEKAQLATVTVGADGTVSVTEKARAALTYKLYRAGEEEAVEKADKAGKYYLEIEKDGETEIVVFTVAQNAQAGSDAADLVAPGFEDTTKAGGSVGGMIAGIVIGGVALLAACVVCVMLIVKGRKKS